MVDEAVTIERAIRYWGWATRGGEWFNESVGTDVILDEVEAREKPADRLVQLPDKRGLLGSVAKRMDEPGRTLVLDRLEPAQVLKIMQGGEVTEQDLGEDASVMSPSWFRFHSGNHVAALGGPGGPGKADLAAWLNRMEVLGDTKVSFVPILSRQDYRTLQQATRVNAVTFRFEPNQTLDVDSSVLSEVSHLLHDRLGEVSFTLSVRARKGRGLDDPSERAAENLRTEVGRLIQADVGADSFKRGHVEYDRGPTASDLELLESQVTATVRVGLGGRGIITDASASAALTQAYEAASDKLTPAIRPKENGNGRGS